jgi:hypothetical protein
MKSVALIAALAIALATPALAWSEPQAATRQPSARALSLSKQYLQDMNMPKQMDAMMGSLMPQMMASMGEGQSPETVKAVTEAARESTAAILPKMMDLVAVEYAKIFTEDELQALVDFYGGPYGKSIVEKMPKATPAMVGAMSGIIQEMQADMTARVCAKLGCPAAPSSKKTAT